MNTPPALFDRSLVLRRRNHTDPEASYLLDASADRIAEHFDGEINRKFPIVAELDPRSERLQRLMQDKAGVADYQHVEIESRDGLEVLPLQPASVDMVISALVLHWVNDLPGILAQSRRALKPGGLFLGTMLGGATLHELRAVMMEVEQEMMGGVSPRISPMVDVRDAGMLLQRVGFALPVASSDMLHVQYRDVYALMHDLRAMGENNALKSRNSKTPPRGFFDAVDARYKELFGQDDGTIIASLEVLTLTGWES